MLKTYAQQTLEANRGKGIREIVTGALERCRGRKNMVVLVAADLGTSEPTLRSWCHDLGISIADYRSPAATEGSTTKAD